MSLNYFRLWISDYLGDTSNLPLSEHGAYLLLLLEYYRRGPLPGDGDSLNRICRAISLEDQRAVESVAGQFFPLNPEDGRRHNKRADEEIAKATQAIEQMSAAGQKGASIRWGADRVPNAGGDRVPNRVPYRGSDRVVDAGGDGGADAGDDASSQPLILLTPQPLSPSAKEQGAQRSRGSRLPPDWQPSVFLKAWAEKERPDLDLRVVIEMFKNHWKAKPGKDGSKLDWDATFKNWVHKERPGSRRAAPNYDRMIAEMEEEERRRAAN